ncbi:MAG TPA: cation-translocating P-type ATPase [Verrucomicrobiales bacterium]|jgi:Cd2+/Zn2+-exporting ATPase|nr:cation-translocating P-type ATPase [Verrucomicrobiales bacterium]HIL23873.1 cation-translocating P-type ATPase [Verrucomicrobiota bacterium]
MSNDATQQLEAAEDAKAEQAATTVKYIFVGILFVINGFVADWFLGSESSVGDLSAMVGAFILGIRIFRTTIHDLRQGLLTTNELVAIAVLATFSSGEYHAAGLVAFFMLLGEMIESRTASGAKEAIRRLIKLTPTRAIRLIDGTEEEVAAVDLAVGDRIRVRPGDNVPADGDIVLGTGSINQANITGESLPVDKKPGDSVFQGTINLDGMLEVEVTKVGEQTEFGRVRELILQAAQSKTQLMKIVDKYMGFYTPLVLVIGALVWAFTQDLNRVISVFIVSSPVAFILATPTAMVAAVATASRLGILIKQVSDIELAARINAFVFDKTGTITTGTLTVSRLAPVDGVKPAELLLATATAEQYSNHPTAKAIGALAATAGLELSEPTDFKEIAGKGVQATVDGDKIMVGREMWLNENEVTGDLKGSVDIDEAAGFSLVFVSRNGEFIGWVGMTDEIRPEAAEALEGLRNEGVRRLAIVSGDRIPVADRVAAEVGCEEVRAECLPGQKVEYIQDIRAKGYKVAFVGDGVNDAPALKAGDIGIAMGAAGSDVAIQSATIALMNNDLRRLPFLVHLSRMTRNVINQNFFFGILFVIIGLVLATLNYITPVLAALLNVAGSLIVVFNSARLVREGEEFDPFEEGEASGSESQGSQTAPVEPELAVEVA